MFLKAPSHLNKATKITNKENKDVQVNKGKKIKDISVKL